MSLRNNYETYHEINEEMIIKGGIVDTITGDTNCRRGQLRWKKPIYVKQLKWARPCLDCETGKGD